MSTQTFNKEFRSYEGEGDNLYNAVSYDGDYPKCATQRNYEVFGTTAGAIAPGDHGCPQNLVEKSVRAPVTFLDC